MTRNKSDITQSEKRLTTERPSFVKKHSASIIHSTIGSLVSTYLIQAIPSTAGLIAGFSAFLRGLPIYLVILIGSVVFFLLSIARYLSKDRQSKGTAEGVRDTSPKELKPVSSIAPVIMECPDKWLHEVADQDSKFIEQRVKVLRCEIERHDLRRELYVDFKLTILNASVYDIAIDEHSLKGNISLNRRLLSKGMKITENAARFCKHSETKDFIVRQWLDRDEIASILSGSDDASEFQLTRLDVTIKGSSDSSGIIPKSLEVFGLRVPTDLLRELYQPLEITVQQATYRGLWAFSQTLEERALFVHLEARIRNPRPVRVDITDIKLAININGKDYSIAADRGILYESINTDERGKIKMEGRQLINLLSFTSIEIKQERDGWLQFYLKDVGFEHEDTLTAILIVTDANGDQHRAKCSLEYKSK